MPHSQKKRVKKTSAGINSNKKNPMSSLMRVLNNKGQFVNFPVSSGPRYSVVPGKEKFNPEQVRRNRELYPHLFMD